MYKTPKYKSIASKTPNFLTNKNAKIPLKPLQNSLFYEDFLIKKSILWLEWLFNAGALNYKLFPTMIKDLYKFLTFLNNTLFPYLILTNQTNHSKIKNFIKNMDN